MIITIDGPAGSGKSTISKLVAKALGVLYLDTGAMYRAVALQAERQGIDFTDGPALGKLCERLHLHFSKEDDHYRLFLGKEDVSLAIRTPQMDMLSSRVSSMAEVRAAMTSLQRKIGNQGDLVAEGRDMGTVVFPDAEFKFFLTASPEVRTKRRFEERLARGEMVEMKSIAEDLKKRDEQDSQRVLAPLRRAADAKLVDTTELSPQDVVDLIMRDVRSRKPEFFGRQTLESERAYLEKN